MGWDKVPIIISVIIALSPLILFYKGKYSVKLKHRKIVLQSRILKSITEIQRYFISVPIASLIYLLLSYKNGIDFRVKLVTMVYSISVTLIIPLLLLWNHIKISNENYSFTDLSSFKDKIKVVISRYISVPFILFVIALNLMTTILIYGSVNNNLENENKIEYVEEINDKIKEQNEKRVVNDLALYLQIYIINVFIMYVIRGAYLYDHERNVKNVIIHYRYKDKLKIALGVDYKSLSIESDYISFHSENLRHTTIIKAEDLIRIDYHY